jgi:hypothetical protein
LGAGGRAANGELRANGSSGVDWEESLALFRCAVLVSTVRIASISAKLVLTLPHTHHVSFSTSLAILINFYNRIILLNEYTGMFEGGWMGCRDANLISQTK